MRVLSCTLTKARKLVGQATGMNRQLFRNRLRSARRQVKRIIEATRQRGPQAEQTMEATYQHLLATTQAVVRQAQQVVPLLRQHANRAAQRLAETLQTFIPRVEQVIAQTTRRVVQGEQVPAAEKLVRVFEPETAIIRKGKVARPTEFGRVVWLDEVDGGIISRFAVLEGNPVEAAQVAPSVEHHQQRFAHPPKVLAGDRGTYSAAGEQYALAQGIAQVVLPKPGAKSAARRAHQQQRWFQRGRRWRAGIEGRISGLKRRHRLDRCRYHGTNGMERWVGWGVIAHDLRVIARSLAA